MNCKFEAGNSVEDASYNLYIKELGSRTSDKELYKLKLKGERLKIC